MNHGISLRKLNRTSAHRQALLRNLAIALIEHKQITTTVAKAKTLRPFIEKLVTRARDSKLATHRYLFSKLRHKASVKELIQVIGPYYANRPGGYVRIVRNGFRAGDAAPMAVIQFVEDGTKPVDAVAIES